MEGSLRGASPVALACTDGTPWSSLPCHPRPCVPELPHQSDAPEANPLILFLPVQPPLSPSLSPLHAHMLVWAGSPKGLEGPTLARICNAVKFDLIFLDTFKTQLDRVLVHLV